MSKRLDKLNECLEAKRDLLTWFGIAAAGAVIAAIAFTSNAHAAEPDAGDGWWRVTNKETGVQVQAVAAPVAKPGEEEAEAIDTRYIRLPGATLAEGRVPTVHFSRGVLTPKLDHTYELTMGGTAFTLTVRNGLRNAAGVAWGEGAVYTVTSGGETWSFHVPASRGWDTTIVLAADLDGDDKPDFIVQADGQEALLMSSRAKPGMNPPAASLVTMAEGR